MFPTRYFPARHFPVRYFPPGGTPLFSFTAAALIKAEQSGSFDIAAVMRKPTSSSTTASAILQAVGIASLDANAILLSKQTASMALNAVLQEASTPFFIDAVLLSPEQGNFLAGAWIGIIGNDYDLDAITSILEIDFSATTAFTAFDGTTQFINSQSTTPATGFTGGVVHTDAEQSFTTLASLLELTDLGFTQTTRVIDFTSQTRETEATSSLDHIDFDGGTEEVEDG